MSDLANELFVRECCAKLVQLQAWPIGKVDVDGWLSNFGPKDRQYALHMLSEFIFMGDRIVDTLFESALQNISNLLFQRNESPKRAVQQWKSFIDTCLVVPVDGQRPNPSDSGNLFARKTRQLLEIREARVVSLKGAVKALVGNSNRPIVFVDDFVGSGKQFIRTLKSTVTFRGGKRTSVAEILNGGHARNIYYCTSAMTEAGRSRINQTFPAVMLSTGNSIGPEYSWTSAQSQMWPAKHRVEGIEMVRTYSKKLGYVEDNGGPRDWEGFEKLALGVAFSHCTPNANLPLFFHEQGWKPLVRRV